VIHHDVVAVLTYPGHFLLTASTIKSYLQYHSAPHKLVVVVDDMNEMAWPTYVNDCQTFYTELEPNVEVVAISKIAPINQLTTSGWVRQQITKLYLDLVVDAESWFFTDGDIVFLHPVPPTDTPFSMPIETLVTQKQNSYVGAMLKTKSVGIKFGGEQVCVSNPAFRTMYSKILKDLRTHLQELHGKESYQLHATYPDEIGISEWELIENFKQLTNIKPNLVQYAPHPYLAITKSLNYFSTQFITGYGVDATLSREWFEQRGISVPDEIWNRAIEILNRTTNS
jgi:hypothetical protein